jgi:hypothetical protein
MRRERRALVGGGGSNDEAEVEGVRFGDDPRAGSSGERDRDDTDMELDLGMVMGLLRTGRGSVREGKEWRVLLAFGEGGKRGDGGQWGDEGRCTGAGAE